MDRQFSCRLSIESTLCTQVGLRYIVYFEATLLVLQFIHLVVFLAVSGAQFNVQFCVGLFCIALWSGVLYGAYMVPINRNHNWLIPHLIFSVESLHKQQNAYEKHAQALTVIIIFVMIMLFLVMVVAEGETMAFMIGMGGNENNLSNVRVCK